MEKPYSSLQSVDIRRDKDEWRRVTTQGLRGDLLPEEDNYWTNVVDKWARENNSQLTKNRNMAREVKKIETKDILKMLESGHTRYKKDDEGFGSIQEKLGLTIKEMQEIFKHPKLANRKTKFPSRIQIIDSDEVKPEEPKKEEPKEEPKVEEKKEDDVFS